MKKTTEARVSNSVTIIHGDCRDVLKTLADASVNCCVTSPPYFGLRDYGTAKWVGGDPNCKHIADKAKTKTFGNAEFNENRPSREETKIKGYYFDTVCAHCGAVKQDNQIGLEETPEQYINKLVEVFREVRRVLRDDGTLWVNIGDSYSSGGRTTTTTQTIRGNCSDEARRSTNSRPPVIDGIKPKDLIGIPWMLAFALRADGWYLRQDIIWHKPNPMPESVKDRCTKAHEYVFLLSKSPRYYYDNKAIMEPAQYGEQHANKATSWGTNRKHPNKANVADYAFKGDNHTTSKMEDGSYGRNKRSVWTVATKPYKGAHFAVFPPQLIKPCILAGCPAGGVVLDPFGGSGTTGEVAAGNGRDAILIELNPAYVKLEHDRCGLFAQGDTHE